MLRKLILFLLFLSTFEAFAQKEIFFSSTPTDSIKVQSMHGIEIESGISLSKLFNPYDPNDKSFRIPLYMGYFNEKRIAPSWTLITILPLVCNEGSMVWRF
jgi:hypothetical protein